VQAVVKMVKALSPQFAAKKIQLDGRQEGNLG
jgi:hypothetical protein